MIDTALGCEAHGITPRLAEVRWNLARARGWESQEACPCCGGPAWSHLLLCWRCDSENPLYQQAEQ